MFQPLYVRPLTTTEKESLQRCSRSSNKEEAWRADVILHSSDGKTATEISQILGFHSSNIKKWIRKYNEDGLAGIAVKKRGPQGGPRPKFSQDEVERILELYKTSPVSIGYPFDKWTPQKLATAAVERGVVESISHVTVRQILKRTGSNGFRNAQEHTPATNRRDPSEPTTEHFEIGKRAFSGANYEEAVEHFYAVLTEDAGTIEQEAITRSLLSRSLEELSKFEEAYRILKKYENPEMISSLSTVMRARLRLRLGWVQSELRNHPEAIASFNDSKVLFHQLQDEVGVSESQYALGRTYIEINEYKIARDHLRAAVAVQKMTINHELLARIYVRLGVVDFNEGAFSSAKENYLKALNYAEKTSNVNLIGMILSNLGTGAYQYPLERKESKVYLSRGVEYLSKGGRRDYLAFAYNNLADNVRCSGYFDEAMGYLTRSLEISEELQDPRVEVTARITLGQIFCDKGDFAKAETELGKCLTLLDDYSDKWLESDALRTLAIVYSLTGQIDKGLKYLREALRLSTSVGDLYGVTLSHAYLAECHFHQHGFEQAQEYLELAQGRLKEEKSLYITGLVQRLAGKIHSVNNRFAEGKQLIAQSISIFTTLEIPFEEAKSRYEMGLLLGKTGEEKESREYFESAKRIFDRTGSVYYSECVTKSLDVFEFDEKGNSREVVLSPANDILLMQRLIEASASRELLVQEMAAVVHENFPVRFVLAFKVYDDSRSDLLAVQGMEHQEAEAYSERLDLDHIETGRQIDQGYAVKIGEDQGADIVLFVHPFDRLDFSRFRPLLKQVELGLETCSLREVVSSPSHPPEGHRIQTILPGFLVSSVSMSAVIDKIQKIRTSNVTVLITGESGTGKELVARAIHAESARARAIFLPFNCTATPKEIIDSQLFGHRRGAFTGATSNYPGIIKAAAGGTLFLDEIGDLSLEVQPKLMRFLQESEIQPLGETRPLKVDVRVLAATNTNLERAVEDGRFREDLFHRLNIIRIHVPPLRERIEELPVLASHFLEHFSSRSGKQGIVLTQESIDLLMQYDWPGNVRQLRNEIERVVAYASEGARIGAPDLSPEVAYPHKHSNGGRMSYTYDRSYGTNGDEGGHTSFNGSKRRNHQQPGSRVKLKDATAALERRLIEESLDRNKNNLSRTAQDLGLSRRGLRLKLNTLGIERENRT